MSHRSLRGSRTFHLPGTKVTEREDQCLWSESRFSSSVVWEAGRGGQRRPLAVDHLRELQQEVVLVLGGVQLHLAVQRIVRELVHQLVQVVQRGGPRGPGSGRARAPRLGLDRGLHHRGAAGTQRGPVTKAQSPKPKGARPTSLPTFQAGGHGRKKYTDAQTHI